jgi:hypothetical protein
MLLTDPALQYWSCVVAILTTVAVLMLWNKVHGPLVARGLARVGLLVGGYAATAVAVLVSVNIAYGGLIVSVSDLFANVNPPMGQFMHHGCGHGGGGGDAVEARVMAEASTAKGSAGQVYDDAQAPPPGEDPALGGGGHGGRFGGAGSPCRSSAPASAAPSGTVTATPAAAEAHALN